MRRRKQGKRHEYVLYTDQGTPEVYVENQYVGKVANGKLIWTAPVYTTDKTITLKNITVPEQSVRDFPNNPAWYRDGQGIGAGQQQVTSTVKKGVKTTFSFTAGYLQITDTYSGVTTGKLSAGSKSLAINAKSTGVQKWLKTFPSALKNYGWRATVNEGEYSISGSSFTITMNKGSFGCQGYNIDEPRESYGHLFITIG